MQTSSGKVLDLHESIFRMNYPAAFSDRNRRIGMHILFWVSYVLFFGSIYGKYGKNFQWYFIESLAMLPFVMVAAYTTVYAVLPWYLRTRRLIPTILLVISVLLLVTVGERMLLRLINGLPLTSSSILGVSFLYLFLETNFMVGIVFAIKIVKKWFEQQEQNRAMETRNLEKELVLLKAQLQPHFLFNSMNNLYSLSLVQSAKTSEGIAQLAELLQSVLYDCNDQLFPLSKEIKLINNYLELERLRYDALLDLSFNVSGRVEEWNIPPMLLFTFVENCFKHGKPNPEGDFYICLNLAVTARQLKFIVRNSIAEDRHDRYQETGGVGLVNAKKRMDIIYDASYQLNYGTAGNLWEVYLEINI